MQSFYRCRVIFFQLQRLPQIRFPFVVGAAPGICSHLFTQLKISLIDTAQAKPDILGLVRLAGYLCLFPLQLRGMGQRKGYGEQIIFRSHPHDPIVLF